MIEDTVINNYNNYLNYVQLVINNDKSLLLCMLLLLIFRYHVYRQLRPFEKIARLTTTSRAILDDQLTRKANLFRLGYPIAKIPVISMRLTAKDRFQELKELMRHTKSKDYQNGDTENETFPDVPITTITSNETGKKRPGYDSLMSRPRHFSQGHYMNVKPNSEESEDNLNPTVSPQVSQFLIIINIRIKAFCITFFYRLNTQYIIYNNGLELFFMRKRI